MERGRRLAITGRERYAQQQKCEFVQLISHIFKLMKIRAVSFTSKIETRGGPKFSFAELSAEYFGSATLCYSAETRYYSASSFCRVQRRT